MRPGHIPAHFVLFATALLVCSGCARGASPTASDTELLAAVGGLPCTNRFEIEAELAVPGEIHGFSCYDDLDELEFLYRTSDDRGALDASRASWISRPGYPIYALDRTRSFVLVNQEARDALSMTSPDLVAEMLELSGSPDGEASSYEYESRTCAQFASAIAFGYVYEGADLPENISDQARSILESSFDLLRTSSAKQEDLEYTAAKRIVLGNESGPINAFCANEGELFDDVAE